MNKEKQEIKLILNFDKDMKLINNGINPVRKALMGYYGEIIVASEFRKRGVSVERKGNLTGYDLLVNGKKIEVRTSEIKIERAFPNKITAWGWKLQSTNRKKEPKPINYDIIVLVKLKGNWKDYELFMLSHKEVEEVGITKFSGYQTVARVIYLFKNPLKEAIKKDKNKMITKKCIEFNKNPKKFIINWNRLK